MSARRSCCACGKTSYKYPSLTFHKIPPPSRSKIRQEWIARLRIPPRILLAITEFVANISGMIVTRVKWSATR